MKKPILPVVMLAMTSLLTACPSADGGTSPPAGTHGLTVNVTGATAAPVKVTNTTSGAVVWDDTVTGTKTFAGITAGSVMKVEGGAVNGYTPAAQTVTMDGAKTVVLAYGAMGGTALNPRRISGVVTGTDLRLWNAYIGSPGAVLFGKVPLVANTADADLGLLIPTAADLRGGAFSAGCTGAVSDPAAQTLFNSSLDVFSPQGEYLGVIFERVVAGTDAQRPGAVIVRLYSDRAFSYRGTCTSDAESGQVITETVDVSVRQGWNALVASYNSSTSQADLRNAGADAFVRLVFRSEQPGVYVALNPQTLNFPADASVAVVVDATFLQVGGYSGQVALSTDLPGLSVEPSTVTLASLPTLSAQGLSEDRRERFGALGIQPQKLVTKLSFRYNGSQSGTMPFKTLVKNTAGKQVGDGPGTIAATRPSVSVTTNPSQSSLYVARGGTVNVVADLTSLNGFSGMTAVSVSGLPAGATPSAVSAQVTPGTTTTVNIPVAASADALFGTSTLTLTASNMVTAYGSNTVQLSIEPQRFAVKTISINQIAPAGSGVWLMSGAVTDPNTGLITSTIQRMETAGKINLSVSVPAHVYSLMAIPDGDVLATVQGNELIAYRITAAGAVTQISKPYGLSVGVADSQGRLWYVASKIVGIGGVAYELTRWNPKTGQSVIADSPGTFAPYGQLTASNDGRKLVSLPSYQGQALRINTADDSVSLLGINPNAQNSSVAYSNAGVLWYAEYGALKRLNLDTSITTFTSITYPVNLIGLDRLDANQLWWTGSNELMKMDTSTGAIKRIPLRDSIKGLTLHDGGVAMIHNSSTPAGVYEMTISFVK